jgi:hypothetical protein
MLDLLAAVGLVAIAILVWRALAPTRVGVAARKRPMAPDDDPDFLRKLGEQAKRPEDGEDPNPGA